MPQRGAQPVILGDSLCLEEEYPPVSCPEVEDIGSLAVVRRPCGKRMVDANSILQLLFHQCLPWLIFLLRITGCFRASLGMHPTMSQLYKAMGTAGKCWQWWGLEITFHQAVAGSASSSCYTHGERLHNLGARAWQAQWLFPTALQLGSMCSCRKLDVQPNTPPPGQRPQCLLSPQANPHRQDPQTSSRFRCPGLSLSTQVNRDATRAPSNRSSRHGAESA